MSEIMDIEFYRRLIDESLGYALHRIVVDQDGVPVDFIYIDANEAFEKFTGLKRADVVNKKATDVLPGIGLDGFDWIGLYGNVALNGGEEEFDQFYEPFDRYYHIRVFSPRRDYFVTLFTDETIQMRLSGFSKDLLEDKVDEVDYQKITDKMLEISGAKCVIFNLFDSGSKDFTTMSVSGISQHISTAVKILGFELVGRKWKHDSFKEEMTRGRTITLFDSIFDLSRDIVPKKVVSAIDKAISLGQTIVVKIMDEDSTLGDFTLIMPRDKKLNRTVMLELFASQVGLFLRRKEAENEKRISQNRMELAMDASENGYWEWNLDTGQVYMSSVYLKMLGFEKGDLEPKIEALIDLMHPEDRETVLPKIMKHIENADQYEEEFRFRCKNGDWKWISGRGKSYHVDYSGRPNRVVGMNVDISKIKKAHETEQELLQKYDRIFMANPSLMAIRSISGDVFTEVNDAFVESTGYSRDEIVGRTAQELNLFASLPEQDQEDSQGEVPKNRNIRLRTKNSEILSCIYYDEVVESQGKEFILTMMIDITELERTRDEIKHMSNHDSLTGLYNRRFYETEVRRLDVKRNLPISVIMIDVNGLKLVNDAFGHDKGDEMLIKVAEAMRSECRSDEIIARLGGDEFVVLLPRTKSKEAQVISERLTERVARESVGLVNISISCGTGTKENEESFSETIKKADEAMYRKKLFESQDMKKATISQIMNTLHKINSIEESHSTNVAIISKRLAKESGMTMDKADEVFELGLMHDIGKIAIDYKILDKKGKLEAREWIELKRHSEVGYQIMRSVNEYAQMANFVLAHHERWDGSGYPGGLKGNDIPVESRIITIADAYDAMSTDRPFRRALTREEIVAEFTEGAGSQFDPDLVKVFLEKVMD